MIKCSVCGNKNGDNYLVCVYCGNPINSGNCQNENNIGINNLDESKLNPNYANENNVVSNYEINITSESSASDNKCNGFSLAGFVMGILAFLMKFSGMLSFVGLVFSIIGLTKSINRKSKTFAIVGIILNGIIFLLKLLSWLFLFIFARKLGNALN